MTQNSRGFALVIPLILVLFAVGIAGYFAYQSGLIDTPFTTTDTKPQPSPTLASDPDVNKITIQDSHMAKDNYQLKNLAIDGSNLILDISYSGGCEDHVFNLIWTGKYVETLPPQVDLYLVHNANNDNCEAYFSKQLKFDLTPLITGASQQYQSKEIVLNINDYDNLKQQIKYPTIEFVDQNSGFVCPQQKTIDCTPCTGSMCPLSDPQYCHKGTPQYNWIMDNCPDVEIINAT